MSEKQTAKQFAQFLPEGYRKHNVYVSTVAPGSRVSVASYWSGGSRSYYTLFRGGVGGGESVSRDPGFPVATRQEVELQAGDVLVCSGTFCGKPATAFITFCK